MMVEVWRRENGMSRRRSADSCRAPGTPAADRDEYDSSVVERRRRGTSEDVHASTVSTASPRSGSAMPCDSRNRSSPGCSIRDKHNNVYVLYNVCMYVCNI